MTGQKPHGNPGARTSRMLLAACVLSLIGLGISVLHFLWPTPLLFTVFVTFGQGAVALGVGLYFAAIVAELRGKKIL